MEKIYKKLLFVVSGLLLASAVLFGLDMYVYREPDLKRILQKSVLNNRHFSADVQELNTPSGIKIYLMTDTLSPITSISFKFLRSGLAYEEKMFGRSGFLAAMLTEGTENFTAEQYQEFLQQNGIKVAFDTDYDDFDGQFTFPRENTEKALPLLKETLFKPRFAEKEIDILKAQYEVAFAAQDENEGKRFEKITRSILYANHPYSRNPLGDQDALKNITASDLREFMGEYFAKDNLLVSVAGAADEETAIKMVETLFSELPDNSKEHNVPKHKHGFFSERYEQAQDFKQNRVLIATNGVYRNDKDFYPLYIANFIFGGSGLTSRLNEELRGKKALTYGAYTGLSIRDKDAVLKGGFTTSADNYKEAVKTALKKWHEIGEKGVKKDEFTKAKDYMIDSFNLRFDSTIGIASMLTEIQKHNLGKDFLQKRNDYIRAVTFEEVNAAAKKYFSDNYIVIGIGQIENE